jgi:hypothetical protein
MARKMKERPRMDLNLTSMMDVSFQLIIFFILITNFAAADLPELDPPDPHRVGGHGNARDVPGADQHCAPRASPVKPST